MLLIDFEFLLSGKYEEEKKAISVGIFSGGVSGRGSIAIQDVGFALMWQNFFFFSGNGFFSVH